ncbi:hypothetical protein CPB83DRAFT_899005 [Crepidotus variabilis]|uniref:AMP-dependent synthetase/ligase domain-containing protein n=1 Tax=Crepidotus variabilis TaxID=179855 RepID=A0A9P6JJN3_9AGAR|nr:hypothetical protein CPB83DRAFT_899005 [Crepidotus variabilis]
MPHFLQNVLDALHKYSARPLIKVCFKGGEGQPIWRVVNYGEFRSDIERVAIYWLEHLGLFDVQPLDVVGIWITGEQYYDIVSIYGLSRAGFTPEILGRDLAMSEQAAVIFDILATTGAKTIIFDPSFKKEIDKLPLACFEMPELPDIPSSPEILPPLSDADEGEVALVFHPRNGRPKPILKTHRWLISQAKIEWPQLYQGGNKPAIVNSIDSFTNVKSAIAISYLACNGHCMIQPSQHDFDEEEFKALVGEGMNVVFLHASMLSKLISIGKANKQVYEAFKTLTQVIYTGASLNVEDEQWLIKNEMLATFVDTTEKSGSSVPCLTSLITETHVLPSMRPLKGLGCSLLPIGFLDNQSERHANRRQLFDLFVPADAANCPHPSACNRLDEHITGDVFEETEPGGSNDDWIRTGKHEAFCNARQIENNVLQEAADLVNNCIIVGHHEPGIVLLVEPAVPNPADENKLKSLILHRHAEFNDSLHVHEKIKSVLQIILVPQGTLPKTMEKGSSRREAAKAQHWEALQEVYTQFKTW